MRRSLEATLIIELWSREPRRRSRVFWRESLSRQLRSAAACCRISPASLLAPYRPRSALQYRSSQLPHSRAFHPRGVYEL
jgi:hypothetical protein